MFNELISIIYYSYLIFILVFATSTSLNIFGLEPEIGKFYINFLTRISKWVTNNNDKSLKHVASLSQVNTFSLTKPEGVSSLMGKKSSQFSLVDALDFCRCGVESIVQDQVIPRFHAPELPAWNLLTRNSLIYQDDLSLKIKALWIFGVYIRYFIFLPLRLLLLVFGVMFMLISFSLIHLMPQSRFQQSLSKISHLILFRIFASALSAVVKFHNRENRPKSGICVANHTSPLDVVFLSLDCCYLLTAQRQKGAFGVVQKFLRMGAQHIWFNRFSAEDRVNVMGILRDYTQREDSWPILMFPEGTCINNTSVMMFRKGSFEVGGVVYPVAMKYSHMFADCFWDSTKETFSRHIFRILTSWATVVDIWYLPPCSRPDDETTAHFAGRLRRMIASHAQLDDLEWDGQLKRRLVDTELQDLVQEHYSDYLMDSLVDSGKVNWEF